MFLALDGTLFDFFGGREDLAKRRVAFVGTPTQRIQVQWGSEVRSFWIWKHLKFRLLERDWIPQGSDMAE